ncbi:Uncharacterised protein [Tsukamurella pulmonis]|nr:Uncharacterised protein [Tsukamurella pulmonis]
MATITYVTHDGEDYPAPVTPGRSLMQIAVDEAIPGSMATVAVRRHAERATSSSTARGSTPSDTAQTSKKAC